MAFSWNEIKDRAVEFSKEWEDTTNEEADEKPFLDETMASRASATVSSPEESGSVNVSCCCLRHSKATTEHSNATTRRPSLT